MPATSATCQPRWANARGVGPERYGCGVRDEDTIPSLPVRRVGRTGAAHRLISTSVSEDQTPTDKSSRDESFAWGSRRGKTPTYCGWCGKQVEQGPNAGRKRQYCGQACRQRAYERRIAVERGGLPADAVVLSAAEVAALQDRLFQ